MYTEIKELVNFLAVYMYFRIPRWQINLFMERFANHLAARFHRNWRINNPGHAANERFIAIKTRDGLDEMFYVVAASVSIDLNELYACFPPSIFVYCNPGEVICRILEYSLAIIIWQGDVNADNSYIATPTGAAKYYNENTFNLENTALSAYRTKTSSDKLI
uniref:Anti_prolifrtn domain-containing protein n=1 Tax=Elaeophora elaphi TaxID=1147741 RepID=A0A0R3S5V1_9BILA